MQTLLGFLALAAITALCLVVTVLAIMTFRRDRTSRAGGAVGAAMLEVQSLFEPSKRHAAASRHEETLSQSSRITMRDEVPSGFARPEPPCKLPLPVLLRWNASRPHDAVRFEAKHHSIRA